MFTADWFFSLDERLREMGMDSDAQSFDEIRQNLSCRRVLGPDAFAENCVYVILAGGFSQKTAKKIHAQIMDFLRANGSDLMDCLQYFIIKIKLTQCAKSGVIAYKFGMNIIRWITLVRV